MNFWQFNRDIYKYIKTQKKKDNKLIRVKEFQFN